MLVKAWEAAMPKKSLGTHRIKNPDGIEDGVWVTDGTVGFEIPESLYFEEGYEPPLKTLPWGTSTPGGTNASTPQG